METKRYKPLVDKLFLIIFLPIVLLMTALVVILAFFDASAMIVALITFFFVLYFLVSPLCGYVELRAETVFIKYGFFLKKEIPYTRVRAVLRERRFYSYSMMSLKNAFEHVIIKYNSYDDTTVSVVCNDEFARELSERAGLPVREDLI
ncbi:MAG: PH domain-containing protein [Clostridia bacterium]|nr:PH domain-containing protein [Clostridia bacterium]